MAQNPWEVDWSQPSAPQAAPNGGVRIGTPRQQPVPAGYERNADGSVTYIPGGPADPAVIARNSAISRAPQEPNIPSGYRYDASGNLEAIPGGPADPSRSTASTRYMSDKTAGALEDQVNLTLNMQRHINVFNDDFAGNSLTGGLENSLQGMYSGIGTEGQRAWWADFQSTDNLIRNSLFGASLTDGEKAAYERTTVDPSMDPREVRRNLEQRAEILRAALTRRTNYLRASNYNPQQIEAALGDALPLVQPEQNALPGNPPVLPQARGVQADPGVAADGVIDAGRGGSRVVPELFGLGDEIASIIQQGGTREQAVAHYQARMTEAGIAPSPDQIRDITYLSAQHRANPRAPVKSLMTGWEQFHMVETPDEGGSILGAVADSPVGASVIGLAQGLSAGNLGNIAGADAQSVLDYSRAERPVSTFMGDAVGSTATLLAGGGLANAAARGTGMLARGGRVMSAMGGLGVDTAYGGIRGASEAAPGERLSGAFLGAVMAGTGNRVGAGAANLGGRAIRGVTDPSVRYLADRGINMSMGQLLGNRSMLGRTINRLESAPVLGDMLSARRAESIGDYARAQLTENLAPIGYTPPTGPLGRDLPFSQDMLADAQRAVGDSYNFLDGRTFATDPQGIADIGSALNAGRSVPRVGEEFNAVVNRNVGPLFDQSGNFTGQGYQDALQQLRAARSDFGQDGAMGNMAADATSQLEDALNGIVVRQAPDLAPQLRAANEAYRGLVPIENAAISGFNNGGLFTPTQYGRAAVNNTRNFGGRAAAARGDVPGSQLQQAAQDIIPSAIPDSGTAGRLAALALPTALGGAAIGANTIVDYPITSAGLGALALLSTRGGSRMLQRGMMGGARRQRLGNRILRNQDAAGTIGATSGALLIPALSSSGQ